MTAPHPGADVTAPQGDILLVWAMWGLVLVTIMVTYARLSPDELYHVSREGLAGGLSRVLVGTNYPIALVAMASALIALDVLGGRWWWLGGPAIAACAVTVWPGVVDDGDLDARAVNVIPAVGVATAVLLSTAAARRSGVKLAAARRFDLARTVVTAVVAFLSLPWIFALAGVYIPEFGFIAERPITGADGSTGPAVHLGDHHGFDGALLLISAVALSRPRLQTRRLAGVTTGYVSLMAAYGGVNFVQDLTNEQLYKRGSVSWRVPAALNPSLTTIWLVILALATGAFLLLQRETAHRGSRGLGE